MRLIDAENIKTVICDITNDAIEKNQTKATIQKRLILAIEKIPTLDVKPVIKGKWIEKEYGYGDTCYDCSVCGESFWAYDREIFMKDTNFCPYCGADMREAKE